MKENSERGQEFACGDDDTNYESGSGPKNVGCAIGIKAVHMRAVGEPNGDVARQR
jgi:hypothetical protein